MDPDETIPDPVFYLPISSNVVKARYAGFDVVALRLELTTADPEDDSTLEVVVLFDSEDAQAFGNDLVEHSLDTTPLQEQPGTVDEAPENEETTTA